MSHNAASRPQPTRRQARPSVPARAVRGAPGDDRRRGLRPRLPHMDGALFRQDVITLLEGHGAEHAIKVPFYPPGGAQGPGAGDAHLDPLGSRSSMGEMPEPRRQAPSATPCSAARSTRRWTLAMPRRVVRTGTRLLQPCRNYQLTGWLQHSQASPSRLPVQAWIAKSPSHTGSPTRQQTMAP
jgi:hypothetical protein